ncbi:MAG TPA: hypothetical protein PKE21_12415 [Flavobacteriales bacterium]|nr:hypothetical protein [Flavobacteriales bacterium]HMR28278.1 hypothetical protein [Flavobacteriales bacterium]
MSKPAMEAVFAALLSADDAKVLGALAAVESRGDVRAIRPLLHALAGARDQGVRQRITSLLNQVKVPGAAAELIAALDEPTLAGVRPAVLSALWNAGLDVRDHLEVLVGVAISGTSEECFECLTVVENQELWPERAARTSVTRLRNASATEADPYKAALLNDLRAVLDDRLGRAAED